jgi:hypothetical protein
MTRVATIVPAESDLLCEGCGYTLNGLPEDSNCPECGKPIQESIGSARQVPKWERENGRSVGTFLSTSADIIFRPTRFYKNLATRRDIKPARQFATVHWIVTSVLFGLAMYGHLGWYLTWGMSWMGLRGSPSLWIAAVLILITYLALHGITIIAARLTTWEAAYRGLRLPINVVLRGMFYHAAHYVPVALAVAVTVYGYQWFERTFPGKLSIDHYLYILCGEVILFAGYLFNTYWIGMRNMMYANR